MIFLVFIDTENSDVKIILTTVITEAEKRASSATLLEIFKTLRQNYPNQHFQIKGSGIIEIDNSKQIIHVSQPHWRFGPASEHIVRELLREAMIKEGLAHYRLEIIEMKP